MPEYGPVPDVRRIAVLRANDGIGDYVVALPALDALRATYPDAEIVLVGARWHADFLTGRPGPVDRVVVLPTVPDMVGSFDGPPDTVAVDRFLASMRRQRFDLALQMHGGGRQSNPLVSSFGARITAGLRTPDAAPLDRFIYYDYFQPEVFRYLAVAALVGARPTRLEPVLDPVPADEDEVDALLRTPVAGEAGAPAVSSEDGPTPAGGGALAVVHPGATDPRRRWPLDRFAEVGTALAEAGAHVVVTGAAGDGELPARLAAAIRAPVRLLAGRLSLGGLTALMARSAVVVSNDTGPLHVAQAVGARTVGVYWCGNLVNIGPLYRSRDRPQVSWISHCPVCTTLGTADVYPGRADSGQRCGHRVPFVTDVPVEEVRAAALDLLRDWHAAVR